MISGILSWFNLVVWGFFVAVATLLALLYTNIELFIGVFIVSSIVLHSYAALKLRKSIKNPVVPLGSQTPIGIRLMGAFTLFLGIIYISQGITIIQNMQEVVKSFQEVIESLSAGSSKNINPRSMAWGISIFSIVLGLSCVGNAILNFRMLKWYLFSSKDEQDFLK